MRRLKRSISFETTEEVESSRNLIKSGENLASVALTNSNMKDCKQAKWTNRPKLISVCLA